ncbi:MAG TPA: hemolysin III family protein [Actinomycetota bacterium]|nr:hemolysin III family protein [Actinomycetota bacterium]
MGSLDAVSLAPKPRLRGRIHEVAFFCSIPAALALVLIARGPAARIASAVYALSLVGVFGVSASYHRGRWSSAARRRMKRVDHSMIYVLIAGSYTPVSLLVLDGPVAAILLAAVWMGASVGVALKITRIDGFRAATGGLYVGLGWLVLVVMPQLIRGMTAAEVALLLTGGAFYTLGAIVFAAKRPDPRPSVFGFHEVWHALMVTAAACHFAMIALLVR